MSNKYFSLSSAALPEFSVICPIFNTAPEMLKAAVDSVIHQQEGQDIELLLIDDASTSADTIELLENFKNFSNLIRVIELKENGGPSKARQIGIESARGKWTTFLDADDLWPDGAHKKRKGIISDNPDIEWLGGNIATLDSDNMVTDHFLEQSMLTSPQHNLVFRRGAEFTKWLISDNRFHLGGQCIRTDILRKADVFKDRLRYGEDWLFFIKLSILASCHFSNDTFYILRRQHESMMTSSERSTILYVSSKYLALRIPSLAPFRRELRWALYSSLKGLALDNAFQNNLMPSFIFALRALMLSPTEIVDFLTICRVMLTRDPNERISLGRRYSAAETRSDLQKHIKPKSSLEN